MGRRTALTAALLALAVLAPASSASANWTHKGKGELKENASVTLSGELTLSTTAGNVKCPTTIGATLTASSSAGDVSSFTVSEPSKCDLTGSLAAICGTNGLTKVEKTGTWALAADETDITLSSIDIHYSLGKCLVPGFRLKGSATVSVDKTTAISSATFSGSQTLYNALGEESGSGSLESTLTASPAATYGIKTAPTVEPKWTDGNEPLSEDGELALTGDLSFSYSGGAVTCSATQTLLLTAATIEEGDFEGEVKSFAVAKPAECDITGTLASLCKTNGVASVEKTGTWNLTATEEDITISNIVLDYKFNECAIPSLRIEGDATLAVEDSTAIKKATLSGKPAVFNSSEEKIGTAELGGTPSASPSGTFAIKEGSHEVETEEHETETHAIETHEISTGTERLGVEEGEESDVWTYDGVTIEPEEKIEQSFEGFFGWEIPAPPLPVFSSFGCEVTITIVAEGPSAGQVTAYDPTTATCEGTGIFAGCELVSGHTTNPPWDIDISETPGTVTGPIVLHNVYAAECSAGTTTVSTFNALNVTPSTVGKHLSLAISGTATNGVTKISGSFTAE